MGEFKEDKKIAPKLLQAKKGNCLNCLFSFQDL